MAPKKKKEEEAAEEAPVEEEEEVEPEEPEILKKCFRVGSQTYYGDCKLGYGARKGTYVRHGFGRQVSTAITPSGQKLGDAPIAYETSVMAVYEGNWEDDVMSGQGVYTWSDGSSYDGAFVNGKTHGPGRFMWPDGSTYEGTWHSGQMTGHGRLDYRFDGSFWQGRFQRDAFQKHDGKWIDVWQQTRGIERKQILSHKVPCNPSVKRCACGEIYARSSQPQMRNEQIQRLTETLASIRSQGYTPFVIGEASLKCSVLQCLTASGLTNHATQSVSIRMAAIAKRRKRDFNGKFHAAIQTSLQTGSMFAIVFEDDDEGCGLLDKEEDRWYDRQPSLTPPSNPLPEEWEFRHFYHPNTFPPEVLQPMLFNGRLMSKLFLPESLREDAIGASSANSDLAPPSAEQSPAAEGTEEAAEDAEPAPARQVSGSMSQAEASQRAAAPAPVGCVGLTGHVFELPDVPDPRSVGLRLVHHVRPAIVALSSLASGMKDDEISGQVVDRFKTHVPMQRTMLVLLTHDSTTQPDHLF